MSKPNSMTIDLNTWEQVEAAGDRAIAEIERLRAVLAHIEGGDTPCTDEAMLRQWAYEGRVLGRRVEELTRWGGR